jgi:hypothetical protein
MHGSIISEYPTLGYRLGYFENTTKYKSLGYSGNTCHQITVFNQYSWLIYCYLLLLG